MWVQRLWANSPQLKRPGPPHPARTPPVRSPAASAGSLSPRHEPRAAGAAARERGRGVKESWVEFHPVCLGSILALPFRPYPLQLSVLRPREHHQDERPGYVWRRHSKEGVWLSKPPGIPLYAPRAARQLLSPAPPLPPRASSGHAHHPQARAAHSQAPGPSPSNAVRVPPVMPLAATSRTPGASPRPVQHHHTGDKVDHLPRTQHKQITAGVTTPVPITGVGIMVKERVRSGQYEEERRTQLLAGSATGRGW